MPNQKNSHPYNSTGQQLSAIATILLLSSCSSGNHSEQDAKQIASEPAPAVVVTTVAQRNVPIYSEFVGRTDASQTVDIRARVEGVLEHFSFKEGDFVSKGQLLFSIDKQSWQAALEQAQAELARAEAEVQHAQQQLNLKREQAELASLESALVLSRQDLDRVVPLVKDGALEKRQLDVAVDTERRARSSVEAQKAKVRDTALNQDVELKQSNAHVSAAKAAIKQASLNLSYTAISSPLRGIIGKVKVHPGNLVGRGENTLLATISAVDPIRVDFSVSEAAYLRTIKNRTGQGSTIPLQLALADGSTHPYQGRFKTLERAVNPQTGTISVQAEFPNPQAIVRPGQFARIRLAAEQRQAALLVPQRCVQDVQGVKTVMVVRPDNKVALRTILLGPRYESFFVIEDGLKAGEKVILEGLQKARPGETVTVSSTDS